MADNVIVKSEAAEKLYLYISLLSRMSNKISRLRLAYLNTAL